MDNLTVNNSVDRLLATTHGWRRAQLDAGEDMSFDSWSATAPLGDLLVQSASRFPARKAIVFPERAISYAALLDGAVAVARGIIGLGLAPRSNVGLLANNGHALVHGLSGSWHAKSRPR